MIVITGGAGFIGSVLVWKFNQMGRHDIVVVDENAPESPKWQNVAKRKFTDYLEHNAFLEKLEAGAFKGSLEAIVHMGAISSTTEQSRERLEKNNFEYTRRLAECCLKNNVRFLYASSAATYGSGERGYSDDDKLIPKLKPLNPYGQSKHDFDLWILENHLQKQVAGFKFFNVFGPNEYHKGHMRSLIHKGYEQIKKQGKMRLFKSYRLEYPDGEQTDPIGLAEPAGLRVLRGGSFRRTERSARAAFRN